MKTNIIKIISPLLMILLISGCSTIKGIGEGILGTYIGGLERARADGKAEVFDYAIGDCFDEIIIILNEIDAKVLKLDIYGYKILAVVYKAVEIEEEQEDVNTADVGIFLTKVGSRKTKVQINCFSFSILKYASETIFAKLTEKTP